jgi:hypothetical protein
VGAQQSRREGHERHAQHEQQIQPLQAPVDPDDVLVHPVMSQPHHRDDDETQHEGQDLAEHVPKLAAHVLVRPVGVRERQDEQGDGDREHGVGEEDRAFQREAAVVDAAGRGFLGPDRARAPDRDPRVVRHTAMVVLGRERAEYQWWGSDAPRASDPHH